MTNFGEFETAAQSTAASISLSGQVGIAQQRSQTGFAQQKGQTPAPLVLISNPDHIGRGSDPFVGQYRSGYQKGLV